MQDYSRGNDLRSLHRDLISLTQGQLRTIDRLWIELESRISDFRLLLDDHKRKDASRKQIESGLSIFTFE